ncbi:hypothetical protein [Saccharibacillus alkalitolerans]|uniref:Lipoprotein n=1 Tax=Saccharibacillus alkalitolerans TaxID=2705290 RepID=A0ABX0F3X9_9BACL|nr:hypothetical protein [Saccharibacillus alkalitolerans]NGZ74565.1 hypothetical protein [Saccharibacillus alkalitolerans]
MLKSKFALFAFLRQTGFAALLLTAAVLSACGEAGEPPRAEAESLDGERMSTVTGTYSWGGVEADSEAPPELIRSEKVHDFVPKGGLRLEFEGEEPFQISAGLIDMENPQGAAIPVGVDGTTLTLPKEPGYYALQVKGVWKNDDYASYALSIRIVES